MNVGRSSSTNDSPLKIKLPTPSAKESHAGGGLKVPKSSSQNHYGGKYKGNRHHVMRGDALNDELMERFAIKNVLKMKGSAHVQAYSATGA